MKPRHNQANLFGGTLRTSFSMQPALRKAVLAVGLALLAPGVLHAANGTWTATTGTPASWATAANWSGSPTNVGTTAGDVVSIQSNVTGAYTINLNADRTMGTLTIGDPTPTTSTYHAFTLNAGSPVGRLIMDKTGTATSLISLPTAGNTAANIINAGILLNDNLEVNIAQTSLTVASLTLGGAIDDGASSYSLKKTGVGLLTLSLANTYDGGTTLSAGRVTAANAASFGTGPVTVEATGAGAVGAEAFLTATAAAGYPNDFTINGIGVTFTSGNYGAIRFQGATTAGSITVASDARISAYSAATGTLNGSLLGSAALELNSSTASFNGTFNLNGNASGYTGALTLSQGRLNLGAGSNPGGSVTIKEGITGSVASIGGETTIAGALTLGNTGSTTTGPILYVDPTTSDALHTNGNLTLNGKTTVSLTGPATGSSVKVLSYSGTLTGNDTNLDVLGGLSAYRSGTGFDFSVANQISLTLVTGDVKWTGAAGNNAWNSTSINWTDGSPATFYNLDDVTFDETTAAKAAFTTNLPNATNNDLVFTAVASGAAGEAVAVEYVDPFVPNSTLAVSVTGSTISVSLGTNGQGLFTSTANDIKAAIEASGPASALATVALAAANDGSGLVTSLNAASLAMTNPAITIASGLTVSPGSMTFDHSAINYSISGTGVIGGGGSLTKNGTGMLTLATSNTFGGGVTFNAGRLRAGTSSAIGSGTLTMTGGQLSSDSTANRSLANASILSGSLILGDATDTGGITLGGGCTLAGNTTIDVPTGTAISQILGGGLTDGAGSFSLTKRGSTGVLVLSGANTYDGGTIIEGGRVNAGTATSFGSGPVTVYETGQAYLTVAGPVTNAFTLSGIGFTETTGNHGAIRLTGTTVSGPITLAGDTRITGYGSTGTLSGNIGETGGSYGLELSNYSTGTDSTITVSGNNSYSYGTTVKGAIVIANSNTAFGTGPVTIVSNGTAARITRLELGTNVVIDNDITIGSTAVTNFRGAVHSYSGSPTTPSVAVVNGDILIQANVGNGGHLGAEVSSQSVLRVMGAINTTSGIVPVIRIGTVELGGGGDYTQINHAEGVLKLAVSSGINPAASLILASSATSTFDLNGKNQTLTGLTKGTTDALKVATVTNNHATDTSTLTLDIAGATTYAGTFATGTAALNLVKTGAGTLTLPGTSSGFIGGLSVTDGILNLTGTLGAAGATATMGTGATLSGEGVFGGSLTLSGATLNVDGTTALSVLAAENLNSAGGVTVNLQSLPATPGVIEIIGFGTSLTGNAGNFTLAGASNYRTPVFSVAANAVNLTLGTPVDLTWTGTGGSDWNTGTTSNWNNPTLTASPFYFADNVTFGNTGGGTVGVPANVSASSLVINSNDNWLFQGAGTVSAASVVKNGSGSATFETPVNISGSIALTAGILKLSPPTGVTSILPGAITGAGTLVKGGDGILSLPSANSGFTGSTVISKGELVVGNAAALGTGTLTFGDATTLSTDVSTLTLNSGVVLASPQIVVSATALDARISGIGGSMSNATITKRGTGKLTIGHPSDYTQTATYFSGTSSIVIEKGTVGFSSRTPLATTTTITLGNSNSVTDDTILDIPRASTNDQLVLTAAITLGSGATNSRAVVTYTGTGPNGGAPAIEGTVNLNGRDLYLENSSHLSTTARIYNFKPAISGTGNVHIRGGAKPDGNYDAGARPRLMAMTPGTSTPTPNTWIGDLYIDTGMLQVGNGSIGTTFNAIPDNAVVYMSAGTCMGFGSAGDTFRGLSGGEAAGALLAALVNDNTSGTGTITVTLTSTADTENYVYGGTFTGGTRTMKLNKTGPGTQTFNGACSHTGITAITGGTLIVNNTFTSPITVATGATLGGNMTSTSSISASSATLASAKIAPGNSTGTMTAASATMNTGALLDLEIDDASAPKNDKLVITGTLTLGSAALNLTVAGTAAEPAYVIASYGTLSGTFGTITGKPSNYDLVYNYNDGVSSNNIALVKQTDGYLNWLTAYPTLTGANRAPGVDFDNDGLDNGIEFVIGSDPTQTTGSATSGYPAATVTGGNLVFTFKRSTASKAYPVTVETSTDLATWPPAKAYLVPTADTAGPPVAVSGESVTVTIPMAPDASKFARIKADIPFTP